MLAIGKNDPDFSRKKENILSGGLFKDIVEFIKEMFPGEEYIPLHRPVFKGNEKRYLNDTIDTSYVSSVGSYVNRFEEMMCDITGASHAVAVVNGTNALHLSLMLSGVQRNDEVLSQSLTFIATCNAISYIEAVPVFIDIERSTLGMSPDALLSFLEATAELRADGFSYNRHTGRKIKACIPMHTFGLPSRIDQIAEICSQYNIVLIEDAAESIGSTYLGRHTGTFGLFGVFSFNGNKTVTCGGGGALITNDTALAKKAKHLTSQAKVSHPWAFIHDEIGYNFRMPNLNAALACAQLEQLDMFVENKRSLTGQYASFFENKDIAFIKEPENAKSNYWLNAVLFKDIDERDAFLQYSNDNGVMTRPVWELMHRLPMFSHAVITELTNSEWVADRLVNIPSSVRL